MTDKLLSCESCGSVNFECCACAAAVDLDSQQALQNRASAAEQQVAALTQRLDMANRLNTDAREQLAKVRSNVWALSQLVLELREFIDGFDEFPAAVTQQIARIDSVLGALK